MPNRIVVRAGWDVKATESLAAQSPNGPESETSNSQRLPDRNRAPLAGHIRLSRLSVTRWADALVIAAVRKEVILDLVNTIIGVVITEVDQVAGVLRRE